MTFNRYQLFHGRVLGTPCGEESEITVGDVPADQQTPRPHSGEGAVVFAGIEIGQFEIGPVMQARAFGSVACRQTPPCAFGKISSDRRGAPANHLLLAPGMEHMVGGNAQNITLARFAERGFEFSRAVHAVCRKKREGHLSGDRAR